MVSAAPYYFAKTAATLTSNVSLQISCNSGVHLPARMVNRPSDCRYHCAEQCLSSSHLRHKHLRQR
jgi:hypothetical protein